jgi:hypothetical protein
MMPVKSADVRKLHRHFNKPPAGEWSSSGPGIPDCTIKKPASELDWLALMEVRRK